jgi:quercetin dioxygenase-like cupin family protein
MRVVKKKERSYSTHNNLKVEHIASKDGLRMMIVEFPPGGSMGQPNAHDGKEVHLVLKGKLLAEQGEDSYIVEEGDSFSWNACVPHFVKNVGEEKAVVLISIYSDSNIEDMF